MPEAARSHGFVAPRSGAVLGVVAEIFGVRHADLASASGIKRSHVRGYLADNWDVSPATAARLWRALAELLLRVEPDAVARRETARRLGDVFMVRAQAFELLTSEIAARVGAMRAAPDMREMWTWYATTEAAVTCAALPDDADGQELRVSPDVAFGSFGEWLRKQCAVLGLDASPSVLATRATLHSGGSAHERARKRFERYLAGAVPRTPDDGLDVLRALVGSSSIGSERAQHVATGLSRALAAARAGTLVRRVLPSGFQSARALFADLRASLGERLQARALTVSDRVHLALFGCAAVETRTALGEIARSAPPTLRDPRFVSFVRALSSSADRTADALCLGVLPARTLVLKRRLERVGTTAARQSLELTRRTLKERGVLTPTTMLHWLADERAAGGDLRGAFALLLEAMAGQCDATRLSAGALRDALRFAPPRWLLADALRIADVLEQQEPRGIAGDVRRLAKALRTIAHSVGFEPG